MRASFAVDAVTDAYIFQAFVQQLLGPALRPGDVVIWDKLPAHKTTIAKKELTSALSTANDCLK